MADERLIVTGGVYLTSPTTGLVGLIDGDEDFIIKTFGRRFKVESSADFNFTNKFEIIYNNDQLKLGLLESATLPASNIGDSFILSSKNLFIGAENNNEVTVLGETTFKSPVRFDGGISGLITFNGNVTVSGEGTSVEIVNANNPRFVATTPLGQTVLATAASNGDWFPETIIGDTALRGSKNLHLGVADRTNFSTFINGKLLLNGFIFKYGQGEWTPQFKYVRSSGSLFPQANITYDFQKGYYLRSGDSCTLFFDLQFTTNGGDAYVGGVKFAAIGNLPVRAGIAAVSNDIISSAPLTIAEFPDGLGVDLAPAISAPVFTSGFKISSYEEGFEVPLFTNVLVNIPSSPWTADGYHLVISADCKLYGVDILAVPPWTVITETHAPLNNFHITSDLITYPGCRFAGSISYLTDD